MGKEVRVEVFYSPSCVFSFHHLEKIRAVVSSFGKRVVYEEIDTYRDKTKAERAGIYGLIPPDLLLVHIDGSKCEEALEPENLAKVISKALEDGE